MFSTRWSAPAQDLRGECRRPNPVSLGHGQPHAVGMQARALHIDPSQLDRIPGDGRQVRVSIWVATPTSAAVPDSGMLIHPASAAVCWTAGTGQTGTVRAQSRSTDGRAPEAVCDDVCTELPHTHSHDPDSVIMFWTFNILGIAIGIVCELTLLMYTAVRSAVKVAECLDLRLTPLNSDRSFVAKMLVRAAFDLRECAPAPFLPWATMTTFDVS